MLLKKKLGTYPVLTPEHKLYHPLGETIIGAEYVQGEERLARS